MGSFSGMDVVQVRHLASKLHNNAEEIREIMYRLNESLKSVEWAGPDRERFIAEWNSLHMAALKYVITGVETTSEDAARNAREQEAASRR